MPRGLDNWSYRDLIDFLKENGFSFYKERGGSHSAWIKKGVGNYPDRIVEVNLTHKSYAISTLKIMIRQSGIDQKEWRKWASS